MGLALALGLVRRGVRTVLLERRASTAEESRAPGVHVRTREIFREWGVDTALREAGTVLGRVRLWSAERPGRAVLDLDLRCLADEAREPGLLVLSQARTEAVLLEAVRASGLCEVRFGTRVEAVDQDRSGVRLRLIRADGEAPEVLGAAFVVGCDGARSSVRSLLGLSFDGLTYPLAPVLADVRVTDARDHLPWPRVRLGRGGITAALRLEPGTWRIIRVEASRRRSDGPSDGRDDEHVDPAEVERRVREVLGPGPVGHVWSSRFRIHRRAAERMRRGRVLLAGDAGHVHSPVGGQGMNAGIQDAHALAWRLAECLAGGDVDRLLDSYDTERRAVVVGDVSRSTGIATRAVLQAPTPVRRVAFAVLRVVLRLPGARRRAARRFAMLDLGYPRGALVPGGRSSGGRLPDVVVVGADGAPGRLLDLAGGRWAVVGAGAGGRTAASEDAGGVAVVRAAGTDGHVPGPLRTLLGPRRGWLVVRPDGYVAGRAADLPGALAAVRRLRSVPSQPWRSDDPAGRARTPR